MNNSGNLFSDELTEWLLGAGYIKFQCQISIYYKYVPYETKIVVLSYVDDCVYWYTSEAHGKWFVETLGKIFHVNFLGYEHWFVSIRISQMTGHSISVDQAKYDTSIVKNTWIMPQLIQVQSFTIPLCHLILFSPKLMHLPVMSKLRS